MPTREIEREIERIIDRVKKREQALEPLYDRMDEDYLLWDLAPFKPRSGEGIADEDAFTDNQPRVDADKIINFIASAERVVRVENDNELKDQRETNNNAERVAIGMLREADRRLLNAGTSDLQNKLGWFAVVRGGWVAARALLRKKPGGATWVDVWPLDPRQTVMEANSDGPLWAAHITERSRRDIREEYPKFRFDDEETDKEDDAAVRERVIDYYWKVTLKNGSARYMNAVVIDGKYAKDPTNTFSETFPIVFRLVGANPGVSPFSILDSGSNRTDIPGIRSVGESFFAPNRHIYKLNNRAQSYRLSLMGKAVQGTKLIYSTDGTAEIVGDADEKGADIPLSVADQQKIELLPIVQLTRDADVFAAYTAEAAAKGGLTNLAHGATVGHEASGRALTILRSAIGEKLNPYLTAVQSCIEGVADALLAQYATGRYRAIKVSGRTRDRKNFSREIEPTDIEGHGPVMVRLRAQLPEDALEKWQIAQIATTPNAVTQESLASSQFTRDEILDMQDGDYETSRQFAMKARMSTPVMLLATQIEAALEQEEFETAEFIRVQMNRILEQQEVEHFARMAAVAANFGMAPEQMLAAAAQFGSADGTGGGSGFGGGLNDRGTQRNPAGNLRPEVAPQSGTPFGQANGRQNPQDPLATIGLEEA